MLDIDDVSGLHTTASPSDGNTRDSKLSMYRHPQGRLPPHYQEKWVDTVGQLEEARAHTGMAKGDGVNEDSK